MRLLSPRACSILLMVWGTVSGHGFSAAETTTSQQPVGSINSNTQLSALSVSPALFSDLERLARLVDITYCVGTTGVYQPFSCASRCKDFPNLHLASTWNTGPLLSDSCGFVAVDHGSPDGREEPAIYVAFRGTYSLANTVVDLSTVPQEYVPYPDPGDDDGDGKGGSDSAKQCTNCTVHMGFLESWRQARKLVLPVLKGARAANPGYPVRLVGHSLGGAVACLAALDLRVGLGWSPVTVTTFGEPQAGNAAFAGFVDRTFGLAPSSGSGGDTDSAESSLDPDRWAYRRVTHAGDPVPLLPLREWGYRPHAGELYIAKQQLSPSVEDLRPCRGDEDEKCSAGGTSEGLLGGIPTRLRLWQLLFAHRDYFWRLGLCVPGGDPSDWWRPPYKSDLKPDEL